MARHLTQLVLTVATAALLTGCSGMTPQADNDAPSRPTSRPMIFGRHAWEADQRIAAERAAAAQAQPAPVVAQAPAQAQPVTPPAVVAQAPTPAAPPVVAQPAQVAPAPVAVAEAAPAPEPVAPTAPAAPTPAKPAKKPGFDIFHHDAKPQAPAVAQAPVQPAAPQAPKVAAEKSEHKGFSLFGLKPDYGDVQKALLVGGYGNAPDKAAVEAAAAFAVHESPGYVLKGVYSAKTQVVAGTNYSLCLWVRTPGHEANPLKRRLVAALVFQGLDKHYELTSWHEVETCQAGT